MELEELKNKAIRSVVALTGRTIFLQLANFLTFNFLAAFLGLVNIGVFVAVSALRDIFNLFIDVGLGAALIQKKDEVTEDDLATTFYIQEVLVLLVVAGGFFLSNWVKAYMHLSGSGEVLYQALLLTLFINSLKVIPSILLERKLEFERQVLPQLVEAVVFDVLVIFLAWKGFGLLSYAWSLVIGSTAGLIVYYAVSWWVPTLRFNRKNAVRLVSYGLQYQGKSYLSVIKDQLLTLFLVRNIGFAGIGYWGFAQRWAYSPFRFIVDSVTKVTFPAYSRLQAEHDALRKGLEKSLFAVSLVLFPALVLVALFGTAFVNLVPRLNQYRPALTLLYLLCFSAGISGWSNVLVNVLDATGRVRTTLGLMVMWILLTWGLTIALVNRLGFVGVGWAQVGVALTVVVTIYLVKRGREFSFTNSVFRPTVASLAMAAAGFTLMTWLPYGYVGYGASVFLSVLLYVVVLSVLEGKRLISDGKVILRAYGK